MTIQQEIEAQCRFAREEPWYDLLARADAWVREPGLDERERDERELLRNCLGRVWCNLGCPEGKVQWPAGVTLADVQLRDVTRATPPESRLRIPRRRWPNSGGSAGSATCQSALAPP